MKKRSLLAIALSLVQSAAMAAGHSGETIYNPSSISVIVHKSTAPVPLNPYPAKTYLDHSAIVTCAAVAGCLFVAQVSVDVFAEGAVCVYLDGHPMHPKCLRTLGEGPATGLEAEHVEMGQHTLRTAVFASSDPTTAGPFTILYTIYSL